MPKTGFFFIDPEMLPILSRLKKRLPTLERIFVLGDIDTAAVGNLEVVSYDDFIEQYPGEIVWPGFDERTASSLCYTSGTTGNPKGVLYSHRSTVLHAMNAAHASAYGITVHDIAMPMTPMFHVNAGGLPYVAPLCGAALVLIGPKIDGEIIQSLIEAEGVSFTTGVPTMVTMLMEYLDRTGKRIDSLKRAVIGGSSVPAAMIDRMRIEYGCKIMQLWGMTETSPVGALCTETPAVLALPEPVRQETMLKAGRVLFGLEVKLVADDGSSAAPARSSRGALWVRGPWTAKAYFKEEGSPMVDHDGWFPTGDVAALDKYGFLQILDRTKDVIKSGGEWISSIDIENIVCGHPDVRQAAVIGVRHPKWEERPLLIIVPALGGSPTKEAILGYLKPKIASWWLPDDIVFVDEMPMTATGKIRKVSLREMFDDYRPDTG
ncbi:MAG: AMP-binding protein [Afipia sp.]|nr:AMP-binding protein [Afipia sp.]